MVIPLAELSLSRLPRLEIPLHIWKTSQAIAFVRHSILLVNLFRTLIFHLFEGSSRRKRIRTPAGTGESDGASKAATAGP